MIRISTTKRENKMTNANITWLEFQLTGKFHTFKYRTNENASIVQFWSANKVSGLAKNGWNTTKSSTVQMHAIKALKNAKADAWNHNAPYNAEFLGAQPARAGEDY
jgi:hypothetical protein